MEKGNAIIVILLLVIIAGGGYILLVKYPPLLEGSSTSTTQYYVSSGDGTASTESGGSGEAVYVTDASEDFVYYGEVLGTSSNMKSLDIYAQPLDWDANLGNDGIVLHFTFYDAYGRKVIFSDTSISTQITIYSPTIDKNGQTISPRRIFYKRYTTISSSDEGEDTPYGGIRIPYSDISMTSSDLGIGQIKMSTSLPTGGTIEAYETFLWPKA
ncbi:hypothetical protein Mpet_0788 [Methanolacinia petrolearia DSM 11571]|uniref:Uncharacterized protein n=1 Tax=Methanolacinia petrolearia (strain DSM 11571 / OCM 486 / SEBR 4847) TaxID=679926 RepID=E1RIX4_METP4|nr:hypothetical protein [Methanolacinia petrolearia]ADN35562.1 hypothetical protein Mpet_0788 [Methanolacinia petrolearia DSM 11571]